MTTPTPYAALEQRVADLEQQVRHVLPAKIDAVAYGVSLVHEDVRALRGEVQSGFAEVHAELAAFRSALLGFREETQGALAEIMRRLPPA
jgi:hypothetical protein